jgi:hypothetical protein
MLRGLIALSSAPFFCCGQTTSHPAASGPVATLERSQNPRDLARAAQVLAASSSPSDHQLLVRFLKSPEFRLRLDPGDADSGPDDLWIARPLRTLEANRNASAQAALVDLMNDGDFTSDLDRVDLLVKASAGIRSPGPEVVRFWRTFSEPDSVHLDGIMTALLDNGSPAAVSEFERIMLLTQPDEDEGDPRPAWLHGPMLRHRDNPAVLAMAERLVRPHPAPWSAAMRVATAESLFLHEARWYRPHSGSLPPPRQRTPREGRDTLRRIAAYVEQALSPSPAMTEGISSTLAELSAMDRQQR